ncbi:bifunctional proline dehydrogenase/L-glutamate gamma-semialdehyde dehydrogenase PutA [Dechloromonas denitrificans]|uniref:bifunctional proline dehydrogenase/L-glutamate gamma-semialdehyde dehydrogenase PutA n=1 Tax=Dechloromonas denitrificans TaxID=281362 RepID=UPI001CF83073|nr:bifunctional proline dehydrogenase/L-glutamate gamma-semialdehyde dehydrogenase PutA [Dechloromonas denitrificans]UCV05288.1 bifunctional proline dehydrogenase/L-glutamate gamma-semialdehyde dehydrogenase PutA [Dechloromonas denitrificans]
MATNLREAIRQVCRRDEALCVAALVDELEKIPGDQPAVQALARQLVEAVRQQRSRASGVDHLMQEFALSSQEGVALMCLAEALLRIPDSATVDRLIRDKISHGDWRSHLGGSSSLFVNAATWGMLLTGQLLASQPHGELGEVLSRLLRRGGEPLIRKSINFAMRLLGQQFVLGESIAAALQRSIDNERRGYTHSFDMLGEAALTADDAENYCRAYQTAIEAIGQASGGRGVHAGPGISVKLSALHPRYGRSQRQRVMAELLPRLKGLMLLARHYGIGFNIDAEEAERLELSLDLLEELAADPELAGWPGLGFVVQAYQKRCPFVIDWLVDLARRSSRRLMVRLVKGAYWDSEIKRAQVDGLADYPVYTRKAHTDLAYLVCARRLLAAPDAVYPQFATHNAQTLASIVLMAGDRGVEDYEFQCLHGMGEPLYDMVVGPAGLGRRCRIYAPVGSHRTLLPYLVRRLLENGANSSFVHRLVDPAVSIEDLIEDPLQQVRRTGPTRHPKIPLPAELYGNGRVNSAGVDLADEASIAGLAKALAALADKRWSAAPLVTGASSSQACADLPVRNPADRHDVVGHVIEADAATVEQALSNAAVAAPRWAQTPPAARAAALWRAADLFEANRVPLISLAIREAGKTWGNALAEVREAVDFCRYYGQQLLAGHFSVAGEPPGPAVCISPWNFPLTIFVGEVSAALAAGSSVLAKPAEQTPLIAGFAIELLHQAGIPLDVLQFLPGRGETVGAILTADQRVRSVVFTGSTEVARLINQSIANRPGVRLIAETGGLNAMIVDSSALPEQVVQDVLVSGFDSAGQRCSALRVLCLQHDIAGRVMGQLQAAMQQLTIGNPLHLATDIGPVIDDPARRALLSHIARMRSIGRPVFDLPLPADCLAGSFVSPTLIEIDSLADLPGEVFGPVVHVLRFAGQQLDALLDAINASGYGLTLGVHSRIDAAVQSIGIQSRVGNIYVNRNMVGAVVGVQPFGGEGLSGTGPKAGGPLYLHRLAGSLQVAPAEIGGRSVVGDAALDCLSEWLMVAGHPELASRCAEYAALTLRHTRLDLPGPTGERNTLHFAPRGVLLCLADQEQALLGQIAAVQATGNTVGVLDTAYCRKLLAGLPAALAKDIRWRQPGDFRGIAGVLLAGTGPDESGLRQRLASQPGALIAVYRADDRQRYPLFRMLSERVVSVNTTAAGGNASLMSLGG